jgi:hypothetical protein
MNKLATFLFVIALCLTSLYAQRAHSQGPEPLYFEVSLSHFGGGELRQQVEVRQDSTFRVTTLVEKVRWTVSGKVGALNDGTIPVELTVKYYVDEKQNETFRAGPRRLHLDKEGQGFGAVHGVQIQPSIWTKPRD